MTNYAVAERASLVCQHSMLRLQRGIKDWVVLEGLSLVDVMWSDLRIVVVADGSGYVVGHPFFLWVFVMFNLWKICDRRHAHLLAGGHVGVGLLIKMCLMM